MNNLAMYKKLQAGELHNVAMYPRNADGDYILQRYIDDIDYADCTTEQWIFSIGRSYKDGSILASTTNKFFQNKDYFCLWLR